MSDSRRWRTLKRQAAFLRGQQLLVQGPVHSRLGAYTVRVMQCLSQDSTHQSTEHISSIWLQAVPPHHHPCIHTHTPVCGHTSSQITQDKDQWQCREVGAPESPLAVFTMQGSSAVIKPVSSLHLKGPSHSGFTHCCLSIGPFNHRRLHNSLRTSAT